MRLNGWHLPVEHLSASALALGMQCPEQYRQKHVLKRKEKMFSDRLLGIVDQKVFSDNMNMRLHGAETMSAETMEQTYARYWKEQIVKAEPKGGVDWKVDPGELFETGIKMMLTYEGQVAHRIKPIKVEERFEFNLKSIPVPIIGYIDCETVETVIERKTAKQKVSKPKPGWRFQGRLYSLAVGKPVEWHVITKQVTPKVYTPAEEPKLRLEQPDADETVKMIVRASNILNDFYARYGPDDTWPMTGLFHDWLCDYCPVGPQYEGSCPAWR